MLEAPRHPALPTSFPRYETPPLIGHRKPRCPPYVEVSSVDQLMPYLDVVARRPYNQGLHACWDLKRGERIQLRVGNVRIEHGHTAVAARVRAQGEQQHGIVRAIDAGLHQHEMAYAVRCAHRFDLRKRARAGHVVAFAHRRRAVEHVHVRIPARRLG